MTPCAQCGKRRKLPSKFQVARIHYTEDKYCSRLCCEVAHGVKHLTGSTSVYYKGNRDYAYEALKVGQ